MPRRKKTDVVTLHLRLREELRGELAREAEKRKTSINAEIVRRLHESVYGDDVVELIKQAIRKSFEELSR
jgi:predicted HicB family RNase H-like nuclease